MTFRRWKALKWNIKMIPCRKPDDNRWNPVISCVTWIFWIKRKIRSRKRADFSCSTEHPDGNIQQNSKKVSNKITNTKKILTYYEHCCNIVKESAEHRSAIRANQRTCFSVSSGFVRTLACHYVKWHKILWVLSWAACAFLHKANPGFILLKEGGSQQK